MMHSYTIRVVGAVLIILAIIMGSWYTVEEWDGKLPVTMIPGGAIPMINVQTQR